MRPSVSYRRYVVGVLFVFMLLHETDRLLIGPLTPDIMATFHITMTQMGAVSTGALIVGAVLYPVWGYAYDRFSRPKLAPFTISVAKCDAADALPPFPQVKIRRP